MFFNASPFLCSSRTYRVHGTTLMPMDFAWAMMLIHSPWRLKPDNRSSVCFIFAISYTCFKETFPIVSWPGRSPPRMRAFLGSTFAACRRSQDVTGVLRSNVKDRSGRMVTRAGIGVPTLMCAVRALNSCSRRVIHTSPNSQQLSQQPAYLAKVHRLHTFTSQRWANWRAGTGLPGAHDELHHDVLWDSFGGHCCGCPCRNKPETE